ncbi:cupin domain-containing protein [Amycolatopsis balhimycina DSM 5908]|uniref:Cupin domain-containing protein n=1 Tax=Amycolatopsis balhimycina DSM 5908 TaxID=1081091 RepID=A0A428WPA8_AMYBA|nr:cupin domain-containing protein [Amycolatopsis balhimycina]RSM44879.1 cupin domain-containing protein [Amycolatopsis balhimycina DSM 5908]
MAQDRPPKVRLSDIEPNRRRGGDLRVLLSPRTVGSTTGFMGALTLLPGEFVAEHYHPYSEEFLYVVRGRMDVRVDGEYRQLAENEGLLVPIGVRHRVENNGTETSFAVFSLGPLASEPHLGHVDTEEVPHPEIAHQPISGRGETGK